MIGHRLEPFVVDTAGHVHIDGKALNTLDWADMEKIDLANVEEGLQHLRARSLAQRKILIVAPVAFSTLASPRSRNRAMGDLSKAASELGMKILVEIRGLSGVPTHRILEIISLIKPSCLAVVGHVGIDPRAFRPLRHCGFSGVCVTHDGVQREEADLQDYLTKLSMAAKASVGACMIQGLDNLRQVAVARLAGISHASVKTSALHAAG